jgi:hypothetical protein
MSLIDRVGTFLGYAPIHGVDTTKNGYPQLVLQCEASHYYDEDVEDYVDVADQELRAFLVLYGKDGKPLRNCEQVQKVFGWDGLSFQTLAEMDLSNIRFLFRVEEHTWDNDTKLQISWIDVDTASPTRQISSLDTKDLQKLDAKFGLAKVGKKTDKPKPTGKPKPPKVSTKKKDTEKKTETKTATEAVAETTTETATSGPPAPAPVATPEELAATTPEKKTGSTTREAAWNYIAESIPEKALSTEDRANVWNEAIERIHGGPDDDTLTGAEWFQVQKLIISEVIPF